MNIEEIKELSNKMNQVTRDIEISKNYFGVLSYSVHKEESTIDKGMALYSALDSSGMLQLIQDKFEEIIKITSEADNFIYKVADELENKKLVSKN